MIEKIHAIEIGNWKIEGEAEKAAEEGRGFFSGYENITIGSIVTEVLPIIFSIAGILLFLYFLAAGIQLITSSGEPKQVEQAKSRITNALIGAVVVVFAYVFIQLLQGTLGLQGETSSCSFPISASRCSVTDPATHGDYFDTGINESNFPPTTPENFCSEYLPGTYPNGPCYNTECQLYCYK